MERYFKRNSLNPPSNNPGSSNPPSNNPSSSNPPSNNPASSNNPSNNPPSSHPPLNNSGSPKRSEVTELDEILVNLPADPGLRPPMTYYNPNFREQIRRAYLQRGPCQPKSQNDMPQTLMGESNRRFLVKWFDSFIWLEYSKEKDAAFCLHCYLFKCDFDKQGKAGSDVFIEKGFKNWRKGPENFRDHVGQVGSLHNKATQHCTDLMNQKQHVETGQGLNQETTLKRPCDTRWNSHYDTLLSINTMFHPVVKVLEWIVDDVNQDNLGEANRLLKEIQTFDFVFHLYLMKFILGVTNDLSKALQKKDQDIVNAMMLVQRCKQKLQSVRDDDFDELLGKVSRFCGNNDIDVPNMDDLFLPQGRSRRKAQKITNRHYYRVDLFLTIIDKQLVELNNRFTEVNTELLLCMACLSPAYNFAAFDKQKILCFAKFYPQEFNDRDLMKLEDQLGLYIVDMQSSTEFSSLNGITDLAEKLVNTGRSRIYNYVYLLVTLALVLPVATASVERAFSAMNIVKTPLRNKMGNQWLSDSLVVYIEKDIFSCISNANIMRRFHDMKPRRQQL